MNEENKVLIANKAEVNSFAESIRSWLSIELTIKIFGVTVIGWKFPPNRKDPINI